MCIRDSISDEGDLSRALEVVRRCALPGRQRRGRRAYQGPALAKAFARHGVRIEVVRRSDGQRGFVVLARRWVVERTLSWLMRSRRLARDCEMLPAKHEAMVLWSMTMIMSSRLAGRRPAGSRQPPPQAR